MTTGEKYNQLPWAHGNCGLLWQLRAPVCVAGTISSVHEDYVTETGVCLAPAVNATTTHVVLEIDRSRMTFSERNVELSFADVMDLRDKAVSQLDT